MDISNNIEISNFTDNTNVNGKTRLVHKHMYINNGNMYISHSFALELLKDCNLKYTWQTTPYTVSFNYGINSCKIQLNKVSEREINNFKYHWYVTGSSGSKGFDDYFYPKKQRLDKRILYKIHKKIISLYFESKVSRYDKIKKLLNV